MCCRWSAQWEPQGTISNLVPGGQCRLRFRRSAGWRRRDSSNRVAPGRTVGARLGCRQLSRAFRADHKRGTELYNWCLPLSIRRIDGETGTLAMPAMASIVDVCLEKPHSRICDFLTRDPTRQGEPASHLKENTSKLPGGHFTGQRVLDLHREAHCIVIACGDQGKVLGRRHSKHAGSALLALVVNTIKPKNLLHSQGVHQGEKERCARS